MDEMKALTIVSALANGVNPLTGEVFPADSPYQAPDVVRALYLSLRALESRARPRSRERLPGNAGKPWSEEEDARLLDQFEHGRPLAELARDHGRTLAGIQARLERHGRLQLPGVRMLTRPLAAPDPSAGPALAASIARAAISPS